MATFVIIFRQDPALLDQESLRARALATKPWAQAHNASGYQLVPRILGAEGTFIDADGGNKPLPTEGSGPLSALLFLEASDLSEAVRVAQSHPAVQYGASIEVRPWAPPAPVN